jgi:DNA mismatch endonuclease (patch repair protein)
MPKKASDKKQTHRKAGHRSWAAGNAPVAGEHQGDIMSPEKRSKVMARIKGKNTSPERTIFAALREEGVYFAKHAKDLPGRPDIVFRRAKLVVFIDGDFWHGWRFPLWQHKLSDKWRNKIAATRARDQRNFRKLRKDGWKVLRIWEHQIERSPQSCLERILEARQKRLSDAVLRNQKRREDQDGS